MLVEIGVLGLGVQDIRSAFDCHSQWSLVSRGLSRSSVSHVAVGFQEAAVLCKLEVFIRSISSKFICEEMNLISLEGCIIPAD